MICYCLCLKESTNVNINIKHTPNKYPAVMFLLSLYGTIMYCKHRLNNNFSEEINGTAEVFTY